MPLPKVKATWVLELNVECPHCGHHHDLTDAGRDFWETGIGPAEHDTDRSRGREATCPECGKDFTYDCTY